MSINLPDTPYAMNTPILLLVFNRPDTTRKVFNEIRKAKPPRLYIAADGPRKGQSGEEENVRQVREIVQNGVDWDCKVETLFREQNLGCRHAVSRAITWFFDQEEEGIILEDDCVPNPTFFRFCQVLLQKYRLDSRISMISGNHFQLSPMRTEYSYYFSRYTYIWGWATWRRAWKLYDSKMELWPELQEGQWLEDILHGEAYAAPFWDKTFQSVHTGDIDSWAYIWTLSSWMQNCLSITPNCNLVSNIGFGTEATHTTAQNNQRANMAMHPMAFPLKHPPFVIPDARADSIAERRIYNHSPNHPLYRCVRARGAVLRQFFSRS